jgi:hypothetical protein
MRICCVGTQRGSSGQKVLLAAPGPTGCYGRPRIRVGARGNKVIRYADLVPLVRRIAGDRPYSLPVTRCIVKNGGAIADTMTCCTPGGQKTTAGERNPATGTSEAAIAGTAIAWQRNR